MDEAYHCPYDGLRMTDVGGEINDHFMFRYYECPECEHQGVELRTPNGSCVRKSVVLCGCKGCSAERHRIGRDILLEDQNGQPLTENS